jgi:ADP-heptose:LPS heptosyltransferase
MRILLIRLRQIGDVVFTTPAVRGVRERHPQAHIAYLVEPAAEAVVAHNPHIDEIIVAPPGRGATGYLAELALIRRLRASAFDLVVDFHGGPRASILAWLSGAPTRIGYDVTGRGWMYTHRVTRPRTLVGRHSVVNQWALIDELDRVAPGDAATARPTSAAQLSGSGLESSPERVPVEMPVDAGAKAAVDARLSASGILASDRIIVMHVSAGNPFRRWPASSFAAVGSALAAGSGNRRVVVTSGPSESGAAADVIERARRLLPDGMQDRVVSCGDFSLTELRALVERAVLYIGGDSGPMHIASTSHVPMVGLYGPTLPARSAPWRAAIWPAEAVEVLGLSCRPCDQRQCEPGDFRCLTGIEPQRVIDASERLLAGAVQ